MNRIGHIYFGHEPSFFTAPTLYAFQIIGSTARQPVCRAVPVRMTDERTGLGRGSWVAWVDMDWLDKNPEPDKPLRASTTKFRSYRVRYDPGEDGQWRNHLIVPNVKLRYQSGNLLLPLYRPDETDRLHASGDYHDNPCAVQ